MQKHTGGRGALAWWCKLGFEMEMSKNEDQPGSNKIFETGGQKEEQRANDCKW